jgi:hypothetical protein
VSGRALRNIAAFLVVAAAVLFIVWLAGFDFTTRGPAAALAAIFALVGGLVGAFVADVCGSMP